MPQFLKVFLLGLTPEQAQEVWTWADSEPRCAEDIVSIVAPISEAKVGKGGAEWQNRWSAARLPQ